MTNEKEKFGILVPKETNTKFEPIPGDKDDIYVKAKVLCPNCGRVRKVFKLKTDEPCIITNIKCKACHIAGFDWKYEPVKVNGGYVYFTATASVPAGNMVKFGTYNERFELSNK